MVPREKQSHERKDGDERKRAVVAAESAPRRASVDPMDEFEKPGNKDFFIADVERLQHEPVCKLIERENQQRERGDAAVRFLENGLGCCHSFRDDSRVSSKNNFRLHRAGNRYPCGMALAWILVDGYSLL